MKFLFLVFSIFLFTGCSEKKVEPKFTGQYPTGQKYKDIYDSKGYNFGYTL